MFACKFYNTDVSSCHSIAKYQQPLLHIINSWLLVSTSHHYLKIIFTCTVINLLINNNHMIFSRDLEVDGKNCVQRQKVDDGKKIGHEKEKL